jgi:hypothetical protein
MLGAAIYLRLDGGELLWEVSRPGAYFLLELGFWLSYLSCAISLFLLAPCRGRIERRRPLALTMMTPGECAFGTVFWGALVGFGVGCIGMTSLFVLGFPQGNSVRFASYFSMLVSCALLAPLSSSAALALRSLAIRRRPLGLLILGAVEVFLIVSLPHWIGTAIWSFLPQRSWSPFLATSGVLAAGLFIAHSTLRNFQHYAPIAWERDLEEKPTHLYRARSLLGVVDCSAQTRVARSQASAIGRRLSQRLMVLAVLGAVLLPLIGLCHSFLVLGATVSLDDHLSMRLFRMWTTQEAHLAAAAMCAFVGWLHLLRRDGLETTCHAPLLSLRAMPLLAPFLPYIAQRVLLHSSTLGSVEDFLWDTVPALVGAACLSAVTLAILVTSLEEVRPRRALVGRWVILLSILWLSAVLAGGMQLGSGLPGGVNRPVVEGDVTSLLAVYLVVFALLLPWRLARIRERLGLEERDPGEVVRLLGSGGDVRISPD